MKNKKNNMKFTDREWKALASALSEEKECQPELISRFLAGDGYNIEKNWKGLKTMNDERDIDVNEAWNKVCSRIEEKPVVDKPVKLTFMRSSFIRVAAAGLVLMGLAVAALYIINADSFSRKVIASTGSNQVNYHISLPDGSNICLNRNTVLTYRSSFGKHARNVTLSGEAFFEITRDASKPFIIDAGKASVKVIGTSFNVITSNGNSAVEVFVRSGKVMLSDNSGKQSMVLEPGYIGTMDSKLSGKKLNSDPNYLAWKTRSLIYNGQTLDIVIGDLKRVYNMEIIADNPDILKETWVSPIDENQSQETIIRLICASFNLGYSKVGNVYHLVRK
ncbi:MAG: FecR family protein [Bacteroidales bacterium]|jgi:ferric-dicitrate binding protein FerR (iron transport regulator)